MKRTLGDFARACGGTLRGADRAYTGVSPTRARSNPASCSSRCAARASMPTNSSRPRRVPAPLARWSTRPVNARSRRSWWTTRSRRCRRRSIAWRAQFSLPVVGVAGSNGKTTVKEMTAAILTQAGATLATRGNLNNHIGVPLTLLRLETTHRFAVIEIGANHPGEVAALVPARAPDGRAHHQRGRGAPRRLRQPRGRGARRGRDGRRPRTGAHRGAQRRRRIPAAVARHDARARRDLRTAQSGAISARPRFAPRSAPTAS